MFNIVSVVGKVNKKFSKNDARVTKNVDYALF